MPRPIVVAPFLCASLCLAHSLSQVPVDILSVDDQHEPQIWPRDPHAAPLERALEAQIFQELQRARAAYAVGSTVTAMTATSLPPVPSALPPSIPRGRPQTSHIPFYRHIARSSRRRRR